MKTSELEVKSRKKKRERSNGLTVRRDLNHARQVAPHQWLHPFLCALGFIVDLGPAILVAGVEWLTVVSLRRVVVLDPFLEQQGDSLGGRLPPGRDGADGRFAAKSGELL